MGEDAAIEKNDLPGASSGEKSAPPGNDNRIENRVENRVDNRNVNRKSFELQKKLKNLNSVTHDSNESIRRRKRRSQINKISGKMVKRTKRHDQNGSRDHEAELDLNAPAQQMDGVVQILENKTAFLRFEKNAFMPEDSDPVVSRELVEKWGLRTGLHLQGLVRPKKSRSGRVLCELTAIEGEAPRDCRSFAYFQQLTSVNPHEFFRLSTPEDEDKSMILLELLTPIGKGQRALIVSPPRSGKTVLMEKIVNGITANHPNTEAMLLLIDERPEEVTYLTRRVKAKVYASCLDKPIHEHVSLSRMVIEIAQRKAERGKDVVILLDSITRMARAFNNQLKSTGRTLSGGVDAQALHEPKKFFGSARKLEEGGSLTIIATALIQTGSQMDEVIFQEFKGTGNMELVLNRKIAEKRIYPAIDINMSGTRREELILPKHYFQAAVKFRRYLGTLTDSNQVQAALQAIERHKTTEQFVREFV